MEKQRVRFSRKHVFEHNDNFDVMHWQYKVQVEAVVFTLSSSCRARYTGTSLTQCQRPMTPQCPLWLLSTRTGRTRTRRTLPRTTTPCIPPSTAQTTPGALLSNVSHVLSFGSLRVMLPVQLYNLAMPPSSPPLQLLLVLQPQKSSPCPTAVPASDQAVISSKFCPICLQMDSLLLWTSTAWRYI